MLKSTGELLCTSGGTKQKEHTDQVCRSKWERQGCHFDQAIFLCLASLFGVCERECRMAQGGERPAQGLDREGAINFTMKK